MFLSYFITLKGIHKKLIALVLCKKIYQPWILTENFINGFRGVYKFSVTMHFIRNLSP